MIVTAVTYMHASYRTSLYSILYFTLLLYLRSHALPPRSLVPSTCTCTCSEYIESIGYLLTICQVYRAVYLSISQQNVPQERHRHDSIYPLVHVVERAAALQHKYDMAVSQPPPQHPDAASEGRGHAQTGLLQIAHGGVVSFKQTETERHRRAERHTHTQRETDITV